MWSKPTPRRLPWWGLQKETWPDLEHEGRRLPHRGRSLKVLSSVGQPAELSSNFRLAAAGHAAHDLARRAQPCR